MSESVSNVGRPMTREQIRKVAFMIRDQIPNCSSKFPIQKFLDLVLPKFLDPSFRMEVLEKEEMKSCLGLAFPDISLIQIRQDVYDRAREGEPEDIFTLAHELGHYLLHKELGLARAVHVDEKIPFLHQTEPQADVFADELLMDIRLIDPEDSIAAVCKRFGVSYEMAERQLYIVRKVETRQLSLEFE